MSLRTIAILLCLAGCQQALPPADDEANGSVSTIPNEPAKPEPPHATEPATASEATSEPPRPIAAARTLAEWRKAKNKDRCAPIVITDDGGAKADFRSAHFSGGWAVAFDQPQKRSIYGVAGTGVELDAFDAEVARIRAQWPYHRDLGGNPGGLPRGRSPAMEWKAVTPILLATQKGRAATPWPMSSSPDRGASTMCGARSAEPISKRCSIA